MTGVTGVTRATRATGVTRATRATGMTPPHVRALAAVAAAARRRALAPSTTRALLRTARDLLAALRCPLRALTPGDVRAFLAARGATLAPSTHAHEASRLRAVLRVLHEEGLVPADLAAAVRVAPPPRAARLLLAPPAVARLLAAASQEVARDGGRPAALRDRAALEVAYGAGLRAAEVRALRVVDLDLDGGTLSARAVKRGADRVLPLPAAAVSHLRRYLAEARPALVGRAVGDCGRVFVTQAGTPLYAHALHRLVARAAARAGLRAHPHALRRALATHLVRAGVSVPAVSDLLGHARLDTTAAYVEVDRDDLRRAVALLDAVAR